MAGPHRRSIEDDEATSFQDALGDVGTQVLAVQDPSPRANGLLAVKIVARGSRCLSLTTWKGTGTASVLQVR